MKLQELFEKYGVVKEYRVLEDRAFSTLALAGAELKESFCTFIDEERYIDDLAENAVMIITNDELAGRIEDRGVCVVNNPRVVYFRLHNAWGADPAGRYTGHKRKNRIGDNCKIHPTAIIAESNVEIGNNVLIEEYAVIRENTKIGNDCKIRSGVKIGGTDFEFKRDEDKLFGVEHYGSVRIGNEVEIQYNTGINRALYPWDETVIDDFTKVDMLVHIAHGVKIGKRCMIVANSGIGGRVTIGDDCWIGFAATIKNGIAVGRNSRVNMGAVVTKDVEEGTSVTGNFAIEHNKFIEYIKRQSK